MRVIQVPFCFYFDPVGGTEVYVEALSRHLQQKGVEVQIAAPAKMSQSYLYHQLPVHRYAVTDSIKNLREFYGEGDRQASWEFSKILDKEKPDLIHLHAFTRGVSLRLVQAAKQRDIPVVFTYHTPTVSCQRGTLLKWGSQICEGKVELRSCAKCSLQGLGLSRSSAELVGNLPPQIGKWLGELNLQGGVWTALRMTELIKIRQATLKALLSEVDHIVAVCNWVKDVLLINEVPPNKISVIRQGLCHQQPEPVNHSKRPANGILRLAFMGRLDPTKGIHILIEALKAMPQLPINLDIYGISQPGSSYLQKLQILAEQDPRIKFKPAVAPEKVIPTLKDYDLLAVPSQWLETGPMVVLEAFAAGVPVIGSNLGGVAELVEHGGNGILVDSSSVDSWSQALQRLNQNKELIGRLRAGIDFPLGMKEVASQILSIYQTILSKSY